MATPINKILSNHTQEFNQEELGHISASLREILGQGGGGGGGGTEYIAGTGLKIVDNVISVNTNGNANNDAANRRNFVEGAWTVASGYNCHAEGAATSALGYGVHAQGMWTCFSSNDGLLNGGGYGPIYWGDGAGATVEGYCNATTSCPMSGTQGETDYGPVHGGVIKVIGNGHVENEDHETDVHIPYPSDALIIYRDGTISAAGKISANGVELGAGSSVTGDYVPYSATELVIGSGNEVDYEYNNVKNHFVQGADNIVSNNNSETFVQGKANKLSIAQQSFVQGFGNSATNYYNFAQGAQNNATTNSLAQGADNTASNFSQAAGQLNTATAKSVAFGDTNTADNLAFAQGESNSASNHTLAQGIGNSGYYSSLVQGYHNSAYNYGLAQGYQNTAEYESFAQGMNNYAGKSGGSHALAQGYHNSAVYQSMAQGFQNTAYYDSFAQGYENSAFDNSMAQGLSNTAHKFGVAIGENCKADEWSIAQGQHNTAYNLSQALGFHTIASGTTVNGHNYGTMAIGSCNNTSASALFVVGNGYYDAHSNIVRSDAFIIYPNGSVSAAGKISANGVELGAGGGASLTLPVNIGTGNTITGDSLGAIGNNNTAGEKSMVLSITGATATNNSFAFGDGNYASADSIAGGWNNTARNTSVAMGYHNVADVNSVALARDNSAYNYSFAAGHANTASNYSMAYGRGLAIEGTTDGTTGFGGLALGGWNKTSANAILVLGNGTSNTRKDAFVVDKNNNVFEGLVNSNAITGNTTHIEGGYNHISVYNTSVAGYNHIEGEANTVTGHSIHVEGAYNIFQSNSTADRGISIEGYANATTANDTSVHGGILKIIGNGERISDGNVRRSDAYILYKDGTVSAKQFQNADGTETINGNTFNFSGVDNIEILPNAATAYTANFSNDNVIRIILE